MGGLWSEPSFCFTRERGREVEREREKEGKREREREGERERGRESSLVALHRRAPLSLKSGQITP